MNKLSISRFGAALTSFTVITYVLCFAWHALLRSSPFADRVFASVFPGFTWSGTGFLIGLGWSVVYSIYTALVFGGLYNLFARTNLQFHSRGTHQTTR